MFARYVLGVSEQSNTYSYLSGKEGSTKGLSPRIVSTAGRCSGIEKRKNRVLHRRLDPKSK